MRMRKRKARPDGSETYGQLVIPEEDVIMSPSPNPAYGYVELTPFSPPSSFNDGLEVTTINIFRTVIKPCENDGTEPRTEQGQE